MANLTRLAVDYDGCDAAAGYVAATAFGSGGDRFPCDNATFVIVKNGSASPITYTLTDARSAGPSGAAAFSPNVVVTVPNAAARIIGPLADRFNLVDGLGAMGFASAVATVTVAAYQV